MTRTQIRLIAGGVVIGSLLIVALASTSGSPDAPAAPRSVPVEATAEAAPAAEAEERRSGFHCLSEWDGNHDGLEALIRSRLPEPETMMTVATRIAPADAQGDHRIQLDFTARTPAGAQVLLTAHGWVDGATCDATLTLIEARAGGS